MASDPTLMLANVTAAAWDRYSSSVWTGGTAEERQRALNIAVKADDSLAEHERAEKESRSSYPKAKAAKAKAA